MPAIKLKFSIVALLVCCFVSLLTGTAKAASDPISATTSATATIPSTQSTTSDTQSPTTPILVRPTDGTTTGDNLTEFVWKMSSDPNGNTVSYTLYLNGVATYLGISGAGNSSGLGYTAHLDGSEIKLKPQSPLADGPYDWRVVATDNSGNSTTSTTWRFLIDTISPIIYLTTVDTYYDLPFNSDEPEQFTDLSFDIAGPKTIYLTLSSEPWATLTTKFFDSDEQLVSTVISPLNSTGIAYPSTHLSTGTYRVSVVAYDQGGNTTVLPDFYLQITQSELTITLPDLPGLPPSYSLPYTPYSLPSLPATIAKIESRLSLTSPYLVLLAVSIFTLLVAIWYRKYNIIFINDQGQSYSNIKIYHSVPNTKTRYSPIWLSNREPISYLLTPSDHGRLYIRHLNRYSTLTIKIADRTYILSLSAKRKVYTLVLA